MFKRRVASAAACVGLAIAIGQQAWHPVKGAPDEEQRSSGARPNPVPVFVADATFTGSSLGNWSTIGAATWTAENGEIVGTPTQPSGGWLIMDQPYQDVGLYTRFRCEGTCNTGFLFRARRDSTGVSGIFVSLKEGDLATYRIALDAAGIETKRESLRTTSATIRIAPPAQPDAQATPGRGPANAAGPGDFRGGLKLPVPLADLEPPPLGLGKAGEWDRFHVIFDANVLRPYLNSTSQIVPSITEDASDYGPIAIYVGDTSRVRFRDLSFKDLSTHTTPAEQLSPRFRVQRLEEFYYGWGAATGDLNRDGSVDIVSGPYYYLGPDFTKRREIYLGEAVNPSRQYVQNMVTHVFDFTGDGWPDVLATEVRPMVLYVNPQGANRRWQRFPVVAQVGSELTLLRDLNGDARPELLYSLQNAMVYATYDPADATAPWQVRKISEAGFASVHSVGVGDINGDRHADILQTAGWWENPGTSDSSAPWKYHPMAFGRWGRSPAGGGEIAVYDVNGDGLNDVVSSLNAHGWGLAWFEQKRDAAGGIAFERHLIMDDYATQNAGGVTFSELHALVAADVDGDGIPDIVTGKRYWAHQDSWADPDAYGPAVLYWFRTVRNPKAPGGAEFVPELIHNRSGVGSQIAAADVNRDQAMDIITATAKGTFVFYGSRANR